MSMLCIVGYECSWLRYVLYMCCYVWLCVLGSCLCVCYVFDIWCLLLVVICVIYCCDCCSPVCVFVFVMVCYRLL